MPKIDNKKAEGVQFYHTELYVLLYFDDNMWFILSTRETFSEADMHSNVKSVLNNCQRIAVQE